GCPRALAFEGIEQLPEIRFRWLEFYCAVFLRPVAGLMCRAEHQVPHRKEAGEVAVQTFLVGGVVPVMKFRSGDDPANAWPAPADIGVDIYRVKRNKDQVHIQGGRRETHHEYREETGGARDEHVYDVHARAGEPVHVFARMMNRVEIPQPRDSMKAAVHPVGDEIHGQQNLHELQPDGLCCHELLEVELQSPCEQCLRRDHAGEGKQLYAGVADEEMLEIGLPASTEDLLPAQLEQPFQRHE